MIYVWYIVFFALLFIMVDKFVDIIIYISNVLKDLVIITRKSDFYNFEKDEVLLNITIHDITEKVIHKEIFKGERIESIDMGNVVIPYDTSVMESHLDKIAGLTMKMLSKNYLKRLALFYVDDIENFIKLRSRDIYMIKIKDLIDRKLLTNIYKGEMLRNKHGVEADSRIMSLLDIINNDVEEFEAILNEYGTMPISRLEHMQDNGVMERSRYGASLLLRTQSLRKEIGLKDDKLIQKLKEVRGK